MICVQQSITKMADKMAAVYQFASIICCGHFNLVIFLRISSNIHIRIASITLWFKFKYEFCLTIDSLDGHRLPVCTHEHPTLVNYYPIAYKFQIWITFIKLSPKFKYGICQLTKMASKIVATFRFALLDTNKLSHLSPYSSSSKFHTF